MKFADTQKDKDQKKLQQMHSNIWNMAGINLSPHSYLATAALTQQLANNVSNLYFIILFIICAIVKFISVN